MRVIVSAACRAGLLAGALTIGAAVPATAQDWGQPWADPADRPGRVDVSVSTGFYLPTDWSDLVLLGTISPAFGILEQVLVQNVRVDADAGFAAGVTYWQGRYGFRSDVGYSRSSLVVGGLPDVAARDTLGVSTWLYGIRGAVGFLEYDPARRVWPYGFVGVGGITYHLERPVAPPLLSVIEHEGPGARGQPDVVVVGNGREFLLRVNQLDLETVLALSYGAGVDLRLPFGPGSVGLRLEAGDTVARSPLRLDVQELGRASSPIHFGRVHHLRTSAGLVFTFGK